jgi:hypothetical protein
MELKYIRWSSVELERPEPALAATDGRGSEDHGGARADEEGLHHPLAQPSQRTVHLYSGRALKFWIHGKEIVVSAGEVLTVPPHLPHKAEALMDTVDLDVQQLREVMSAQRYQRVALSVSQHLSQH